MLQQITASAAVAARAARTWLAARAAALRAAPDAGYTTETVLVTAILAGVAITLGTLLGPAIITKIGTIVTDLSG